MVRAISRVLTLMTPFVSYLTVFKYLIRDCYAFFAGIYVLTSVSFSQKSENHCVGELFWLEVPCGVMEMWGLYLIEKRSDSMLVYINKRAFMKDSCGDSRKFMASGSYQINVEGGQWLDFEYRMQQGKQMEVTVGHSCKTCDYKYLIKDSYLLEIQEQRTLVKPYKLEFEDGPVILVPASLSPGRYLLKVGTIWYGKDILFEDQTCHLFEHNIFFEITP